MVSRPYVGMALSFLLASLMPNAASAQTLAERQAAFDAAVADSRRSMNQAVSRFYRSIDKPSPLKPSENTDFVVNHRGGTLEAVRMSAAEQAAFKAKQVEWEDRCRPFVVQDSEGIRRVQYAQRDCDLSSYNTAGSQ